MAIMALTGWMGCKQDVDVFIPNSHLDPLIEGDIVHFFEKAQLESHFYITSNDHNTIIQTENGTQFHCTANLFVTQNDQPVTGDIEVEILEIFTKGDMIRVNVLPMSETKEVLDSGGEIFIKARQNGAELKLATDHSLLIQTTNFDTHDDMELFYGTTINEPLVIDNQQFVWVEADGNPNAWDNVIAGEWWDSTSQQSSFGYVFEVEQLEWINIDRFLKEPDLELTKICLELPQNFDPANTTAFIVFDDINSVVPLWSYPDLEMFCQSNIPVDYNATMIVISEQGDDIFFFAEKSIRVEKDMIVEMTPQQIGFETIVSSLDNL